MTDYTTREYIIRETTYPDATKQEVIGELVRCKDCKLYQSDADKLCGYFECMGFEPDDYCSQGERKDGDGDDRT